MTNRFLAGLMALAFYLIIAIPAHAQDPPRTEEKGPPPPPISVGPPPKPITPEKQALIREFMRLLNASTNTEAIVSSFLERFLRNDGPMISQELLRDIPQEKLSKVEQMRLKSEADVAARRILARIRAEVPGRVNFGELLERVGMEMYGKHFSEEELKELIAFHKTPVAQKLLRLLPQITAETLPQVQEWVTPTVIQLVREIFTEEKEKFNAK